MEKTLEYYLSLDYPVEIRRIDESLGGGYTASIPSLGSWSFVGDGETPGDAYLDLQAAKKEIFAEYIEEGVAIPEPSPEAEFGDYSGKLMLRMPRELHAKLALAAERNDSSLNQFIVYLLSGAEGRLDALAETKQAISSSQSNASKLNKPHGERRKSALRYPAKAASRAAVVRDKGKPK